MDALNQQYADARKQVEDYFLAQGCTEDQVAIKMNALDLEFFRHLWINGKDFTKNDIEARMQFYIDFLQKQIA